MPLHEETLVSMWLGLPSILIGALLLAALCGWQVPTMPQLVRTGAAWIHLPHNRNVLDPEGGWYVATLEFWRYGSVGLLLGLGGIRFGRSRGRPVCSLAGATLNGLAMLVAYVLIFLDESPG